MWCDRYYFFNTKYLTVLLKITWWHSFLLFIKVKKQRMKTITVLNNVGKEACSFANLQNQIAN